jgi:hypothetical protein
MKFVLSLLAAFLVAVHSTALGGPAKVELDIDVGFQFSSPLLSHLNVREKGS